MARRSRNTLMNMGSDLMNSKMVKRNMKKIRKRLKSLL